MQQLEVDALIARLEDLARPATAAFEQSPVIQAWLSGTLDRDRSFALQAQIYHQVAQTVPLLERCARTCEALAASEPMYALLAQHYAKHAVEESRPAPHDVLLLNGLRRQGFPVEQMPPPCPTIQMYLERGRWAADRAPLRELGRAYVMEGVSGRLARKLVPMLASPGTAGEVRADDFYVVHATADRPGTGHIGAGIRILSELSAFPAFAAKAEEVIVGAEQVRDYLVGLGEYLDALPAPQ